MPEIYETHNFKMQLPVLDSMTNMKVAYKRNLRILFMTFMSRDFYGLY